MPTPAPSVDRTTVAPIAYTVPAWLALGGLLGVEALLAPAPAGYFLYVAALVCLAGFVWAGALQLLLHRIPKLPALGPLLLPTAALCAGGGLAYGLGAPARLDGPYRSAALAVLAACALGGLGLAGLLALAQQPGTPAPRLQRLPEPGKTAVAMAMAAGVGALFVADQFLYVGLYPVAHGALRGAMALLATLAMAIARPHSALSARAGLGIALTAALVLVTLTQERRVVLQAFVQRPMASTLLTLAQGALDLDRDGFPALLAGGDCDDLNPRVFPAAREVPGNGVDDNCYLGDARPRTRATSEAPKATGASPLNVVLVTIDTLRWDRLGKAGPMPNLTRMAESAVVFERAYAPGSWTSISLGSMMRGRYPRRLLWTPHYETSQFRMVRPPFENLQKGETVEKMFPLAWDDPGFALPTLLRRRGMRTIAVVDDGFSQMLSPHVGASRGFDIYAEVNPMRGIGRRGDKETSEMAVEQLRWAVTDRPFFMWVHYFGPHAPDRVPAGKKAGPAGIESGYDRDVRHTDRQLQRLLNALSPHLDRTALFITADHGEAFFRTYRSHGMDLSDELLRVPLLAWAPGVRGRRIDLPVSLVDIMPTVLAMTETPAPPDLDGLDLAQVWAGKAPKHRDVFADNWFFKADGPAQRDAVAVFDGRRKLTLDRRRNAFSASEQRPMSEVPLSRGPMAAPELLRGLMAYIEETGGEVSISDH